MAAFCDRSLWLVADDEDAGCGFDHVVGDAPELVDLEYPVDLQEKSLEEAEVAAGDAFYRGDGLSVGKVVAVEGFAEAAVKLRVVAGALVDTRHANEDYR